MEWLGVWNCIFSGSEFSNFGARNLAKIALSAEIPGFCWKFRPLKNIFRTLENGHSIRHQSIPPLSAGRQFCTPHPPPLKITFKWRGCVKRGGHDKFLPGGIQNIPPPPPGVRVKQVRFGNWRSYSRTEHYLGQEYVILGRFALRFQWRVWSTLVRTMACFHVWFSEVFFAFFNTKTRVLGALKTLTY